MKKIILLLMVLLFGAGLAEANRQKMAIQEIESGHALLSSMDKPPEITIGYCADQIKRGAGLLGSQATLSAAIQLPKYKMTPLVGNKISAIRVGIFELFKASDLEVFITEKLGEEPLYIQKVDQFIAGWNEITLSTPYQIEDNRELFIGYNVQTFPPERVMAVDGNGASPLSDWMARNNSWQHLSDAGLDGNISLQAIVSGDKLPLDVNYNLHLESLIIKDYVKAGEAFNISGTVLNVGGQPISGFDVTYQIGASDPVTTAVKMEAFEMDSRSKFTIPGARIAADGDYHVKVSIANPNGHADEYPADNMLSKQSCCYTDCFPRKVFMEQFTGQNCGNCPSGESTMTAAIEGLEDKIVWVAHHVGFLDDAFTIPESKEYLWLYNGVTYAPAMMLDRGANQEHAFTPVFSSFDLTKEEIKQAVETPAFINIHIAGEYNEDTRVLNVTLSGKSLRDIPYATDLRLNLVLTENGKIAYQSGKLEPYKHDHVVRSILTPIWGEPLNLSDKEYTKTYTYTLPKKFVSLDGKTTTAILSENVVVNAFVSNYDSTNRSNCRVFNAESLPLSVITGIDAIGKNAIDAYYSTNRVFVIGEYTSLTMYDISGKQIRSFNQCMPSFDVTDVNNGTYFVKIIDGENNTVKKILINK